MTNKYLLTALLGATTAVSAWGQQISANEDNTSLFDNFFLENDGQAALAYDRFEQWEVVGGTVDLLRDENAGDTGQGNGLLVELAGSTRQPGILRTRKAVTFQPGVAYSFAFDYKSTDGLPNSALVWVGDRRFRIRSSSTTFTRFSVVLMFDQPTAGQVAFQDLGADDSGIGIDNVTVRGGAPPSP